MDVPIIKIIKNHIENILILLKSAYKKGLVFWGEINISSPNAN